MRCEWRERINHGVKGGRISPGTVRRRGQGVPESEAPPPEIGAS